MPHAGVAQAEAQSQGQTEAQAEAARVTPGPSTALNARDVTGPLGATDRKGSTNGGTHAAHDIRVGGRRVELAPHNCFACGQLNVHGLRIELHAADGHCWTELALASRFEGWEGIAHGGILCTLLDEVMAWALVDQDSWGVTARMSVAFKRPVPIGVPIRAEGWVVRARRRLLETEGHIVDGRTGEVLATSEATYIAADEETKHQLKAKYRFSVGAAAPAGEAAPGEAPTGDGPAGEAHPSEAADTAPFNDVAGATNGSARSLRP